MHTCELEKQVGELVTERPSRSRVFERFGIDYCCGGKLPLGAACERRGVNPEEVVAALEAHDLVAAPEETDWNTASLTELADHIVATHHAYLRAELPRLDAMTEKVARVHGDRHAWLSGIRATFVGLKAELESHMMKEEQILFPLCRRLEQASGAESFHCGSIGNPIRVMEHEHDDAGRALETLRELSSGFTAPIEACNTFRAMLDGLHELEQDLHIHIHKENNILFPRAIAAEARFSA
ncbi:MAG: iron-sulfur cluster repair di-iron protein [Armatimonadetes bacterium]|nr:iron-sulfur cluster repair di-iron protein [Armatimonadota bacterium]